MRYLLWIFFLPFVACTEEVEQTESVTTADVQTVAATATATPGMIHAVYFWLNADADEALKKEWLEKGLDELAKVPSLQAVYYGPPADTEERGVVDKSYDVAWICLFDTPADQDAYQVDPIHLAFVEKYKSLWEKVIVYDNLVGPVN